MALETNIGVTLTYMYIKIYINTINARDTKNELKKKPHYDEGIISDFGFHICEIIVR